MNFSPNLFYHFILCILSLGLTPNALIGQSSLDHHIDSVRALSFEAINKWELSLSETNRLAHLDQLVGLYLPFIYKHLHPDSSRDTLRRGIGAFFKLTRERSCGLFVREIEKMLKVASSLSDKDRLGVHVHLKKCCIKLGNLTKALHHAKAILRLSQKLGIAPSWTDETDGLASVYYDMQLFDRALIEFKRRYAKWVANEGESSSLANNQGLYFFNAGKVDSAIYYYQKGLTIWEKEMEEKGTSEAYDLFFKGVILGNMASCYLKQGHFEQAIPLFIQDLTYNTPTIDLGSKVNSFSELAEAYLGLGEIQKAKIALDSSRVFNTLNQSKKRYRDNLFLSAKLTYQQGKYPQASYLYEHYIHLQDSVNQVQQASRVENQLALYENGLQYAKIDEQQAALQTTQLELVQSHQRLTVIGGSFLIAMFIIAAGIWGFRLQAARRREVESKNREIAAQNQQITQQLAEKEVLIREVHHRVKNNLQLVNGLLDLQGKGFEDPKFQTSLQEVKDRVKSMAILHQKLYASPNLAHISFRDYVDELLSNLRMVYTTQHPEVILAAEISEFHFHIDQLIPLGLIINELVTNAYKHAFPHGGKGQVLVKLAQNKQDETYELSVSDNGVGRQLSPRENSLGLNLVAGLARQLGGLLKSRQKEGSTFTVIFSPTTS